MLRPQRFVAGLLRRQLRCSRAPPAARMLVPAIGCQPKIQAVWQRRSFSMGHEPDEWMKTVNSCMEWLSNVDGSLSFAHRSLNFMRTMWQQSQLGAQSQQERTVPCHTVLADEIARIFQMMTAEEEGKPPLQPSTEAGMQRLQRLMYQQFASLVVYQLLAGRQHCRCRIVDGMLVIQFWNGFSLPDSLSKIMGSIPKVFRPICQPMGDAEAEPLQQSDVFSAVLERAQANDQWQASPQDCTIMDGIKQCREQWPAASTPGLLGDVVVRRLGAVPDARQVASSQGALFVSAWHEAKIVRLGVEGRAEITSSGLFPLNRGMAVNGDTVVGSFSDLPKMLQVGRVEGNMVYHVVNVDAKADLQGFSLTDSHAYFCQGHGVLCLDLDNYRVHNVLGKPGEAGRGCIQDVASDWTEFLLSDPTDTAVVGSKLFVADSGNKRVLCLDMETNKCHVVFEGQRPYRLAADHDGLFVYDEGCNKISHVTMGTWERRHVLGTGIRAYSPGGLPPLSTNLPFVGSMAIGHDGELVYLGDTGVVHGLRMLPDSPRCAQQVPFHDQCEDGAETELSVALQPTCGVKCAPFRETACVGLQMLVSQPLPRDCKRVKVKFDMKSPSKGMGICLVPCAGALSSQKAVDCHMMSSPEWSEKAHFITLSTMREQEAMQNQPFRKAWKAAMDAFHKLLSSTDAKPPAFFLKNQNHVEVVVERVYDPDADSSNWKVVKVMINGKERAGALEPFAVGVDVPMRVCLFAGQEGGVLDMFGPPKVLAL